MAADSLDDTYCKIFVNGPTERSELAAAVALAVGAGETLETLDATVLVEESDDHSPTRSIEFPAGYFWFKWIVELLFNEEVPVDRAAAVVTDVLHALWGRGWAAVAQCHYDAVLPHRGGFDSRELPWPAA